MEKSLFSWSRLSILIKDRTGWTLEKTETKLPRGWSSYDATFRIFFCHVDLDVSQSYYNIPKFSPLTRCLNVNKNSQELYKINRLKKRISIALYRTFAPSSPLPGEIGMCSKIQMTPTIITFFSGVRRHCCGCKFQMLLVVSQRFEKAGSGQMNYKCWIISIMYAAGHDFQKNVLEASVTKKFDNRKWISWFRVRNQQRNWPTWLWN